jgi:hypothetical protein
MPLLFARVLLGLSISLWLQLTLPALAQQSLPTPPDQGAPTGRQRGGASRGDCLEYQNLTALVPVVNGIVWSQTNSPTPDFFFHLPKALTPNTLLELVVQDQDDHYVFQRQFAVEQPSGILAVSTQSAGTGLTPGETYFWTFSIYCDATRPSAAVSVFGTIKRVADATVAEPNHLTPDLQLNLAQQYAAAGIWHEAIGFALSLHQADPTHTAYRQTLESLFENAGLADILPEVPVYEVTE